MGGQLATSETILVSAAGVIAADGAGLSSVKSYSALLTSIAAMPLAGGTFTGNVLFTDNTYTIGAAGATRPSAVHVGTGGVTSAGDIVASGASQRYVYAYSTGGARHTRFYHDNSNGWLESSFGDLVLNAAGGDVYAFKTGTNHTLGAYNSDGTRSVILNPTTVPAVVGSTNLYAIATNGAVVLQGSAGVVQVFKSGSNCTVDVYDSGVTKYTRITNDGTNGVLSTSSGALVLTGSTSVASTVPISSGVYTFATVPTASSYSGAAIRISDRSQKWAYSDGTDWRFFVDGAVIS